MRRQLDLLKTTLVVVTPSDAKQAGELTTLTASMEAAYGSGKWCKDPSQPATCLDIEQITEEMATSRDPARLREVWEGWHTVSVPMKKDYVRFVELANLGAKELGFADTGALWRAKYDMPPDAFTNELDRLWEQVRPLYVSLHAYVRMKLRAKYGDLVPENGPDSRPPDGQHLGAGLVEPRAARRRGLRRTGLFAFRPPEGANRPAPWR